MSKQITDLLGRPARSSLYLILSLCLMASVALADAVQLTGAAVQGGVIVGKAPTGSKAFLNNEPLITTEHGAFVFGFGKDDDSAVEIKVQLPTGDTWQQSIKPEARAFQIQRIDGLPADRVTPPPHVQDRIEQEALMARQARQNISQLTGFTESFVWPVVGRITGVYGSQRILNGEPRAPHWGVDVAAPTGTPVIAPASGRVVLVHPDMYFSGGTVFIDHGHGLMSAFLHLDQIFAEEGQHINQGERFATVGASGRATGPHLDWRVSWRDVRVDAQLLVSQP